MARLTKEELDEVKKKYDVDRLYSYSMLNTFKTSHFEYFLHYVLHKKPDNDTSIYGVLGGAAHDRIERFYNGEIEFVDMYEEYKDEYMMNYEIGTFKFDRNDDEKDASLAARYKENMDLFFNNHVPINSKVATEKFLTAKIGGYIMQGYCDAVFKDKDGFYNIVDWKSSSKYSSKALKEHSCQLTVYAISLMQSGVPLDKIKCCFNFLKYCTVAMPLKNGKIKEGQYERRVVGEKIKNNAKMWLKEAQYSEEDIDGYLKLLVDTNQIGILPDDIASKYTVSDCWVYIDLNEGLVKEWEDDIIATIRDINAREKDYKETKNMKVFWDDEESVKKESYYYATLCGYSANLMLPYKEYLEKLERDKDDDIFGMMNNNSSKSKQMDMHTTEYISADAIDLSWLNAT